MTGVVSEPPSHLRAAFAALPWRRDRASHVRMRGGADSTGVSVTESP